MFSGPDSARCASATSWLCYGFIPCASVGTAARVTALHYEQRRPETTALYRLIATHLETFLAEARAAHERGVPRYVERELRAYLACGIHARLSARSVPRLRNGAHLAPKGPRSALMSTSDVATTLAATTAATPDRV
jgi:hypothetical protein